MLRKKLTPIGTIERVSFPDDSISDIPAKIDTGADSSSIWASSIKMKDGKLSFHFFGRHSVFYQDQPVITTAFKTVRVTNSFGHTEFRYKIKLKVKIGKRIINAWFSLSDRSRNKYPVLVGKNLLKNRFVVDVAKKYLASGRTPLNKVLVLSNNPEEAQTFFDQVRRANQLPVKYRCINYDSLLFYINPKRMRVTNAVTPKTDIAKYSRVYFKSHAKNSEMAAALAEYLQYKAVPFIDKEVGKYTSSSKLTQYMKLACHGLPIPKAICAKTAMLQSRFNQLRLELGMPFVLKEASSDRGNNNYLVNSASEFNKILAAAPAQHLYIAQTFVPNDGFLRAYVIDEEIALTVRRTAVAHKNHLKNHLNKPFGSTNAALVDTRQLPSEVHDIAIRAAESMNRQVVGIDIVQDNKAKQWYILEVNNAPQIRSGPFIDEKIKMIAKYFDNELNR